MIRLATSRTEHFRQRGLPGRSARTNSTQSFWMCFGRNIGLLIAYLGRRHRADEHSRSNRHLAAQSFPAWRTEIGWADPCAYLPSGRHVLPRGTLVTMFWATASANAHHCPKKRSAVLPVVAPIADLDHHRREQDHKTLLRGQVLWLLFVKRVSHRRLL
jgi:hypothetical protein